MSERSLVKKLAEVMTQVKYIQKKGFNKFHKYNYATEADVNEKVREELSKVNVIMIPSMVSHDTREHVNRNGNTEYIVTVNMEFRFIDGDSGEEITFNMSGSGQDAGDKGIFKAIAGAQKYALMKAFMIPTGDDPEADNGVDERNSGKQEQPSQEAPKPISQKQVGLIKVQVKKLANIRSANESDIYGYLKVTDVTKLTSSQASKAIETLNKWVEQAEQEKKGA